MLILQLHGWSARRGRAVAVPKGENWFGRELDWSAECVGKRWYESASCGTRGVYLLRRSGGGCAGWALICWICRACGSKLCIDGRVHRGARMMRQLVLVDLRAVFQRDGDFVEPLQ